MSDAPFCAFCLERGELRNTYKVAGAFAYKCGTCKKVVEGRNVAPLELAWRTDHAGWERHIKDKVALMKDEIRPKVEDGIKEVKKRVA